MVLIIVADSERHHGSRRLACGMHGGTAAVLIAIGSVLLLNQA